MDRIGALLRRNQPGVQAGRLEQPFDPGVSGETPGLDRTVDEFPNNHGRRVAISRGAPGALFGNAGALGFGFWFFRLRRFEHRQVKRLSRNKVDIGE